nr:hypothetical protein Iba_chr09dCG10490 [Ipomoea batatas]
MEAEERVGGALEKQLREMEAEKRVGGATKEQLREMEAEERVGGAPGALEEQLREIEAEEQLRGMEAEEMVGGAEMEAEERRKKGEDEFFHLRIEIDVEHHSLAGRRPFFCLNLPQLLLFRLHQVLLVLSKLLHGESGRPERPTPPAILVAPQPDPLGQSPRPQPHHHPLEPPPVAHRLPPLGSHWAHSPGVAVNRYPPPQPFPHPDLPRVQAGEQEEGKTVVAQHPQPPFGNLRFPLPWRKKGGAVSFPEAIGKFWQMGVKKRGEELSN